MKDLIIQLPTEKEIFNNKERFELPLRKDCKTKSTMRNALKEYAKQKGCYIHFLLNEKDEGKIIYIGQTSKSYAERLNFEFTISRNPVSPKFTSAMKAHYKAKNKIYTVFFTDEKIKEMIKEPALLRDNLETSRRLLFEQVLILRFYSEDLINTSK